MAEISAVVATNAMTALQVVMKQAVQAYEEQLEAMGKAHAEALAKVSREAAERCQRAEENARIARTEVRDLEARIRFLMDRERFLMDGKDLAAT